MESISNQAIGLKGIVTQEGLRETKSKRGNVTFVSDIYDLNRKQIGQVFIFETGTYWKEV